MCESKVLYPTATPHPPGREAKGPTCRSANLFDALPECVRVGGFTYQVVPSDEYVLRPWVGRRWNRSHQAPVDMPEPN